MHGGVALQYIECQVITLAPVCPHLCDFVWRDVLGHASSVFKAHWPALAPADRDILDSRCDPHSHAVLADAVPLYAFVRCRRTVSDDAVLTPAIGHLR